MNGFEYVEMSDEEQTEGCSINFEQSEFAPGDAILKKKCLEVKGKTLKECRRHFDEIWKRKTD